MQIDMTHHAALYIANDESLYTTILEAMVDVYEQNWTQPMTDAEIIGHIADVIEVEVRDFFLSGEETDAGDWLLRAALDTINWYSLAHDEYSDFLADRED